MNTKYINRSFLPFLLFIIIQLNVLSAQSTPQCHYCNKPITERYIKVGNFMFHPEHFLCNLCNKVINASYQEKNGKFYHPECFKQIEELICSYCNKILDDKYVVHEGKKYHERCYEENIMPKCSVCNQPLKGYYRQDIYGNKYHIEHEQLLPKCDCCSRLISDALSRGGRKYSDGRNICNLCIASSVTEQYRFDEILKDVSTKLIYLGLNLNLKNIRIVGVDRNTLKSKSGRASNNMHGFCDSQIRTEFVNDKLSSHRYSHTIYVLNGMHYLSTQSTVAHELMHSWLTENTQNDQQERIREGSCNYISYIYLKTSGDRDKNDFLKLLENDPDPVYGEGFKYIRTKFEDRPLSELLSFLKNKK
jgi:hypothetical protein